MRSTGLRRASLTVLVGSGLGFGISFLLTPVLSRIYSPTVFGQFSTIVAVGTSLVGLSTLRLEVLAQSEPDSQCADALVRLALIASGLISVVAGVGALLAILVGHADPSWWMLAPIVLAGSLQLVGTAVLSRRRDYRALGVANFVQGAGTGVVQVLLGRVAAQLTPLLLGFLGPRLVWFWPFMKRPSDPDTGRARRGSRHAGTRKMWLRSRRFAVIAGASAGLNSVAGQALVLLTSFTYGVVQVGALAMALRVLVSPLGVVGQAAASASIGEVGSAMREGREAWPIIRNGLRDLLAVGFVPCALVALLGPTLAPAVLGGRWSEVGVLMAWLSPGALFQFSVSPFSPILNMTGHNSSQFRWDVRRLLLLITSVVVPFALGEPVVVAVACYSVCQVVLYLDLLRLVVQAIREKDSQPILSRI